MRTDGVRYSYGPVPSRRLGKSLGINNIPAKVCTYACVYCQVGRTNRMAQDRQTFYNSEEIFQDVMTRLEKARKSSERVDYLSFVPDGEPTLDMNLGKEIALLKKLGVPVGVITNGSLLWRNDVKEEVGQADWVSIKVDAAEEETWRRINHPHKAMQMEKILEGISAFAKTFPGKLVTETMLVEGVNDGKKCIDQVVDFLCHLGSGLAYLGFPSRPPAESWVRKPQKESLDQAYGIFCSRLKRVEWLTSYEGNDFASTDALEKDILSITAVHPMRKEALMDIISRSGGSWEIVVRMISRGDLLETTYDGHIFYRKNRATIT